MCTDMVPVIKDLSVLEQRSEIKPTLGIYLFLQTLKLVVEA